MYKNENENKSNRLFDIENGEIKMIKIDDNNNISYF